MDRKLIDQYADGGDKLTEAIAGLSEEQMAAFPVPGTWSIQQIVLQLLDSDLIGAERMKRVTAEDDPLLDRCRWPICWPPSSATWSTI